MKVICCNVPWSEAQSWCKNDEEVSDKKTLSLDRSLRHLFDRKGEVLALLFNWVPWNTERISDVEYGR